VSKESEAAWRRFLSEWVWNAYGFRLETISFGRVVEQDILIMGRGESLRCTGLGKQNQDLSWGAGKRAYILAYLFQRKLLGLNMDRRGRLEEPL
jgi:hypothetical protein